MSRIDPQRALTIAREVYPATGRLPELLVALATVESRIDPDAWNRDEDSRGALQVHVPTWGVSRAPMGAAAGDNDEQRFAAQLRAAREVIADAADRAADLIRRYDADPAEAFQVVWQYSPQGVRSIVQGINEWNPVVLGARVAARWGEAARRRFLRRWESFQAAMRALLIAGAVGAGVGWGVLVFLLLLAARSVRR